MTDIMWSIVVALVGSGGLAATIVAIKKAAPEVRDLESQVAERVLRMADAKIVELKVERDEYRDRWRSHDSRIHRLEQQVRALGETPVNGPRTR